MGVTNAHSNGQHHIGISSFAQMQQVNPSFNNNNVGPTVANNPNVNSSGDNGTSQCLNGSSRKTGNDKNGSGTANIMNSLSGIGQGLD